MGRAGSHASFLTGGNPKARTASPVQNSAAQRSCPSPWGDSIRLGGLPVCIRVEKQLLPGAG